MGAGLVPRKVRASESRIPHLVGISSNNRNIFAFTALELQDVGEYSSDIDLGGSRGLACTQ